MRFRRLIDHLSIYDPEWLNNGIISIDASDIIKMIDDDPRPNDITPPREEYGNIAPPFKSFMIEGVGMSDVGPVQRGTFCNVFRHDSDDIEKLHRFYKIKRNMDAFWVIDMSMYHYQNNQLYGYPGSCLINVSEDGFLMDDPSNIHVAINLDVIGLPSALPIRGITSHIPFTLRAITAMHDSRTEVVKVQLARPDRRRFQQDVKKAHGIKSDPKEFYVLSLKNQVINQYINASDSIQLEANRRAHEVRGHFRHKPNSHEVIYIDSYKRGDDAVGIIKKDYKVKGE